jgi:hypothetical protein
MASPQTQPQQVPVLNILDKLASSMAQLNSHMRGMGDTAQQAVNGFYAEAKRYMRAFDEQRGLRYRPAIITLSATIDGAGTANAGSNDFRVAQNEDFVVHEMRTFVQMVELQDEPAVDSEIGHENSTGPVISLSPTERLLAKAQNCAFTLLNKDTKVPLTENLSPSLASFCPEVGGVPLRFGPDGVPAFIVPHNMTMQVQFALQSSNAIFNTAATKYGLLLSGVYLSREVR